MPTVDVRIPGDAPAVVAVPDAELEVSLAQLQRWVRGEWITVNLSESDAPGDFPTVDAFLREVFGCGADEVPSMTELAVDSTYLAGWRCDACGGSYEARVVDRVADPACPLCGSGR